MGDGGNIPATLTVTPEGAAAEPFLIVDDTQLGTEAGYAALRGAAGVPGEVSSGDLAAAVAGTRDFGERGGDARHGFCQQPAHARGHGDAAGEVE